MRKILISLFVTLVFFSESANPLNLFNPVFAQQKPIPQYAKWGVFALKKTKEKYPNAQVIDFLHTGRKSSTHTSTETFKLWLKDSSKEFGVFINIEFNNDTGRVIKVTFKETSK
ncbi:DUF3889 domain-containing protein [Peribacillus sp. FSL E2-0218]|uniref:DUF3889 domain-containing protein n=1 Tax=Peribacillus sp. FSL E2-0218 TaxID=2921364 RepID=UPI0030EB9DB2